MNNFWHNFFLATIDLINMIYINKTTLMYKSPHPQPHLYDTPCTMPYSNPACDDTLPAMGLLKMPRAWVSSTHLRSNPRDLQHKHEHRPAQSSLHTTHGDTVYPRLNAPGVLHFEKVYKKTFHIILSISDWKKINFGAWWGVGAFIRVGALNRRYMVNTCFHIDKSFKVTVLFWKILCSAITPKKLTTQTMVYVLTIFFNNLIEQFGR